MHLVLVSHPHYSSAADTNPLILTFTQEKSSTTLLCRGFNLKEVLGCSFGPYFSFQVSVFDQKLREVTVRVVVGYVGGLGTFPWLHASVVFVYSYILANCTLPIPSIRVPLTEVWEGGV